MSEVHLAAAAAVGAAVDAGVLDALASGAGAAAPVAERCGLDRRVAALLLDALVAAGAATRTVNGTVLLADEPAATRAVVDMWRSLPDTLRSGRPVHDVSEPSAAAALYATMGERLGRYAQPAVSTVTEALARTGPRVLDLGAGTAPWSRALAAADATRRVTAVDLPGVAELTARAVSADGLAERFTIVAGDLFTVEPGDGFDLVLVAAVCRLFDDATNRRLVRRVAGFARPGATVAVLDTLPDADRSDGASVALYALGLALRTSRGRVHPLSSYATWLHAAGLAGIDLVELPDPHLSLIRAGRPA